MDIYRLIHIILKNLRYILIVPVISGSLMYHLTRNETREYSTSASIFTAITAGSSLENLGNSRVDYFASKTAYNNLLSILNSKAVMEETALRLLASHLILEKPAPLVISEKSFTELREIIPPEIKSLVVNNNIEKTYQNLHNNLNQDHENFLYSLLNFDHPHYSYKALSGIQSLQLSGSDIIVLSFKSNDPGIAFNTLKILINVFLNKYGLLKKNQTGAVVEYFERQLRKASAALNSSEDRLLEFNKSNNIINYYEQTKYVSSQQEKIEVKLQEVLMEYQASGAVLEKLEVETKNRFNINLKTERIMKLRKTLIETSRELAQLEINDGDSLINTARKKELSRTMQTLKSELKNKIDSLHHYEHNTEGIAIEKLLEDWLATVIEYESARARLLAMQIKSDEFNKRYTQFAPLGAILKRIEREIHVEEKAYLEILHHLGLAKLKQQNEEMMAKMKLLDAPRFPIDPEPTKRKMFVIVVAFFSMILTIFGILVFELLDKTVKTIPRLKTLSALPVNSALALRKRNRQLDLEQLNLKSFKQTAEEIVKLHTSGPSPKTKFIQFVSNWPGEGKTYTIELLFRLLEKEGFKAKCIDFITEHSNREQWVKIARSSIFTNSSYEKLIEGSIAQDTEFVLIKIPALSENMFNTTLLQAAHASYFIADAGRTWAKADNGILDNLTANTGNNTKGILNKARPENLVELIGELPKKRSKFRRFIKKQILKRIKL